MKKNKGITPPQDVPKYSLVGHYFHSLSEDKQIEWQGAVLADLDGGWYIVQLFSWIDGSPSVRRLVKFEDMKDWLFYGCSHEMNYSFDEGIAREGGPYRRYAMRIRP